MNRYRFSTALALLFATVMPFGPVDLFIYKSAQAQQYLNGVPVPQVMKDGTPIPDWINASCCGPQDVHKLRPDQVHHTDDYYTVDGYHQRIPDRAAQPSQDGDYWIFYREEADGFQTSPYCFFIPMEFYMWLIPWSYTLLSTYANCPHKAYRKYVVRDLPPEEKSQAAADGIAVHAQIENYLNGVGSIDPRVARYVDPLKRMGAKAETKLGITDDRLPCDFYSDSCYGRVIIDTYVVSGDTAVLVDWKTGKPREDKRELALQALILQAHYPEVRTIIGSYCWLKEDRLGETHNLSSTDRAWYGTKAAVEEMQADQRWVKRPNPLCGWCPVKDCEHNRS